MSRHPPIVAHVTICVGPNGVVQFWPEGDPRRIAEALRLAVKVFVEDPHAIEHAAGLCIEHGEVREALDVN
ncbi:MAG TPA: hypothetical protein VGS98_03340 [Thermoanaerobaculia bacterium]|jgi:hypothetical protein|nr:hypothetical protein [Thermoanaerobaculia bacterium]